MPALAAALVDWIRALALAPVALLGNSFGCQVIAELSARHPELVERAVLQGPTAPPAERTWFWQSHTLVYTAPEQLAQVTRQFLEEADPPSLADAGPGRRSSERPGHASAPPGQIGR